ncbi:MAG: hypothetical protein PF542_04465 [Nanoarchaeota archaeon]|jgi:hypothetical protein|nr:hypothetical protein [Nanoarchaeota archaeon]
MKTLKNKIKEESFFSEFKESLKEGEKEIKPTFSYNPLVEKTDKQYISPKASISFDMPSYSMPSYSTPSWDMDV